MLNMFTIGRNARVQMFAKVVDSFVDRCLWQVIPSAAFIMSTTCWIWLDVNSDVICSV